MNSVIIMGRLAGDVEMHQTQGGVSVATFRVAVDRDYTPKGGERQADFIPCVAWRQTGEFIGKYFQKGRMIALEGSLQTRNYEDKQGQKRTAYEVIVRQAHFCGEKAQSAEDRRAYGVQSLDSIQAAAAAAGVDPSGLANLKSLNQPTVSSSFGSFEQVGLDVDPEGDLPF